AVKGAAVELTDFQIASRKGTLHFQAPTAALLQSEGVFKFSSAEFVFPDSTVGITNGQIDFSDDESKAVVKPLNFNASFKDLQGKRLIAGQASASGTGRIPVLDNTLTDVRLECSGLTFDADTESLRWQLKDALVGVNWQPILNKVHS